MGRIAAALRTLRVAAVLAGLSIGATLGWTAGLAAQTGPVPFNASQFKALKWRNIGPIRGGRSLAAGGSASRPDEYFFGAVGGGLWKTTDGGVTWKPVTDGQIHSSSVGAVAVAPSNPDIIYIGMGETALRGNIMQGDGVYKSTDDGKTWQHMGLTQTQAIARIVVDPTNPDLVYVAAFGHPYGTNTQRGVYRSTDGGHTWQKILYRDDHTGAIDLNMDPHNDKVLYAAMWDANRTPWSMTSGGPGSGLFKTTDGGDHWTEITRNPGLPSGVDGKIGVSVGANSKTVYAIVENRHGGLYRSDDSGATWKLVNDTRKLIERAFYYAGVFADPKDPNTVYVVNTGFYRSTDGGKLFNRVNPPHGDNHFLWIAPNDPKRMIETNDGGGTVTTNGGKTWTPEDYPTAQLYHVSTTWDFPYHVCGAQQDNSTVCVPSRETGRYLASGRQGQYFYPVGGGESGYIAPDPINPNIFYSGDQGARLSHYNRATGQNRDVQPFPLFFSGEPADSLPERWQWTFPIVFSPVDPHILYVSSQHLWRSYDSGQSWQRISPDLTVHDPKTLGPTGGPITHDMNGPEIYATIFSIAPSYFDVNTIWTGSDDGLIYITRDGGAHWTNITPPDMPKFGRVSMIDASQTDPATAYVAVNRYQLDDRAPYIFRTHDYGKHWTMIVNGIRKDDYVHAVRQDPKRPGLLFAAAEHGVWVSFDDGAHWSSLSLNLPDTQIADLVIKDNDVVIGTHGRSMYILDDIEPLREWSAQIAQAPVHLFTPATAYRRVYPAEIDYFLQQPSQQVTVEILDGNGHLVRKWVGTPADTVKKPLTALERQEARPPRPTPKPGFEAGLNRFQWDLRYPGPTVFPGIIMWGADPHHGPWAVPGRYEVRLTANGVTQTREFIVKKDPRLKSITHGDLVAEFDLATKIEAQTSRADEGVIQIRSLNQQIQDRLAHSHDSGLAREGRALEARLTVIENELYQTKNRTDEDPLNFAIKLNNKISALRGIVEGADAMPTDQSYKIFNILKGRLDGVMDHFQSVLDRDLPAFNKRLAGHKLKAIAVSSGYTTS